ncbi:hypothetical protein ACH492_05885 [Streptomyces sp. NPDC019443]|uniref:hypothetical protein n=1 Tax=Streptomyces sp. NPDC019443 TaxID=3365061 RepID=UPI0037AE9489
MTAGEAAPGVIRILRGGDLRPEEVAALTACLLTAVARSASAAAVGREQPAQWARGHTGHGWTGAWRAAAFPAWRPWTSLLR